MTRFRARSWISAPVRRRAVWASMARSRTASPSVGASWRLLAAGGQERRTATARTIRRRMRISNKREPSGPAPNVRQASPFLCAARGRSRAAGRRPRRPAARPRRRAPVAGRLFEEAGAVDHRAALGIVGAPDHPADPRVADGPGAHGAGLQRHIEGQAGQTIISSRRAAARIATISAWAVGSWAPMGPFAPVGDHFSGRFIDDDGAHGNLSRVRRRLRTGPRPCA